MVGPPSSHLLFDLAMQLEKRISPAGFSPENIIKIFFLIYICIELFINHIFNYMYLLINI